MEHIAIYQHKIVTWNMIGICIVTTVMPRPPEMLVAEWLLPRVNIEPAER